MLLQAAAAILTQPPASMPCAGVVVCDLATEAAELLCAAPRACMHEALSDPLRVLSQQLDGQKVDATLHGALRCWLRACACFPLNPISLQAVCV